MTRQIIIVAFLSFAVGLYGQNSVNDYSSTCIPNPDVYKNQTVCTDADKAPEFPGGLSKFYQYIAKNLNLYSCDPATGSMHFTFIIDTLGQIQNVCSQNINIPTADKQRFIETLSNSPKWTPATKAGKKVCVRVRLPIMIHPK